MPDGLWGGYTTRRGPTHHDDPALTEVGAGVDVLQAYVDRDKRELIFECVASAPARTISK